jgi:hypothetical protein
MVQVCMKNRREYRLVAVNGQVAYQAKFVRMITRGKSFQCVSNEQLKEFAQCALDALKDRCLGSITNLVLRVDIMIDNDGNLRVNEFESFEADKSTDDYSMLHYCDDSCSQFFTLQLQTFC